ncbi:MAG: LysR family transcriptional regulator [Dysgonomonas sp.]
MVNLEWYRTFKAIYQHGTLTKAAEELLISQPNVSIQLASLEAYIGSPLFVRHPRKMVPTEQGKRLYTQVVESIDNLEKVEARFRKSVLNKIPLLRLGAPSEMFCNYFAPEVAKLDKYQLEVTLGLASDLIAKLASNDLDVALITQKDNLHDNLTFEPFTEESFMIVCSESFDTSEVEEILKAGDFFRMEKWLKDREWLAYNNNLALIRRFWRENFGKRPVLKLRAVIPDNNSILQAVANGDYLSVSSDLIAGKALRHNQVKVLWKGINPAVNMICFAYNKSVLSQADADVIKSVLLSCMDFK